MATHPDYVIANASGAAVRDDLNKALAAIVSNNSSATDPATSTTTYPHQWWYDTTAGQLKLRNAADDGWVVVPVLDSSGRLLVGTSSNFGGGKLQVANGSINIGTFIGEVTGAYEVIFEKARSSTVGTDTLVASGDLLGQITFKGGDGSTQIQAALITASVDGTPGTNDMPGRLVFSTTADGASSPTERMRIDSNGQVGIGTASLSGRRFSVAGSTSDSTSSVNIFFNSTGTELFRIRNDGAFYSGVGTLSPYNLTTASAANVFVDSGGIVRRSTSSIRFKTDIETLQDNYADAILQCRPVWYRSTAGDDNPSWSWWGFIAEEVAEIDPRLVFWKTQETTTDQEGNTTSTELETPIAEGVQYDRFVPHLLNLVKRQKVQIETQNTVIAALEARLSALEARLSALEAS